MGTLQSIARRRRSEAAKNDTSRWRQKRATWDLQPNKDALVQTVANELEDVFFFSHDNGHCYCTQRHDERLGRLQQFAGNNSGAAGGVQAEATGGMHTRQRRTETGAVWVEPLAEQPCARGETRQVAGSTETGLVVCCKCDNGRSTCKWVKTPAWRQELGCCRARAFPARVRRETASYVCFSMGLGRVLPCSAGAVRRTRCGGDGTTGVA